MGETVLKIRQLSEDERRLAQARMKEEAEWEEASALGYAERKGFEKGFAESFEKAFVESYGKIFEKAFEKGVAESFEKGVEKGKFEAVLGMLKNGLSLSLISECVSIPEADILKFARENGVTAAE